LAKRVTSFCPSMTKAIWPAWLSESLRDVVPPALTVVGR
jgi:hypothetical protein